VSADDVSTANTTPQAERVSGPDRYATSVAVALETIGKTGPFINYGDVENIVIATGENFPDGLAASGLIGALNGGGGGGTCFETLYAVDDLPGTTMVGASNAFGAPQGVWTTDTASADKIGKFEMGDPSGPLAQPGTRTHKIRVLVRKSATGGPDPAVTVKLYEDGDLINAALVPETDVLDASHPNGIWLEGEFETDDIVDPNDIEVWLDIDNKQVGAPPVARAVQVDAIEMQVTSDGECVSLESTSASNVLLLTRPGSLPGVVAGFLSEVASVTDPTIYVVGGTAAVSDDVVNEITNLFGWDASEVASNLRRLDGKDRYETAASIALAVADIGGDVCVVVATGENFPDALAAGSIAVNGTDLGEYGLCAVLLTRTGSLPAAAEDVLEYIDPDTVIIVGGTAAVSSSVETAVGDLVDADIIRLGGANRYETATNIANHLGQFGWDGNGYPNVYEMPEAALLVSGTNFPDALSAAPLARDRTPILLTQPQSLSAPTNAWIGWNRNEVNTVTAIGGTAAVSDTALNAAAAAALQVAPTVLQSLGLILDEEQPFVQLSGTDVTLTAKAGSTLAFPDGNGWELAIQARQLGQGATFSVSNNAKIVTIGVPSDYWPGGLVTIQEFQAVYNSRSDIRAQFDLYVKPGITMSNQLSDDDFEFADGVAVGLILNVLNTQCEATFSDFVNVKLGVTEVATYGLCGDNTQQIFTLWDNSTLQGAVAGLLTVQLGRTPTAQELQAFAETLPKGPLMVVPGDTPASFEFEEFYSRVQIDAGELVSSGSSELENLTRIRNNITWLNV
jgi:putative cell wall-binding protein